MHASADRLEFAPPPQPGQVRAFVLAVVAHLLLMLALTWGINWNRESENLSAEAELWSSVPQQAAPKLIEAPPPPPEPEKKAEPVPPPPPPVVNEAAIALEREKKKQELAERRREELERLKKLEAKKKQEELKREQLAEKKAAEERKKKEELAKAAKTKKQQLEEEKKVAALRAQQIERMRGLAGATGAPSSTGAADRSSGPSSGWAGRIQNAVYPNIIFRGSSSALRVEVEIRMAPDGTIVGKPIIRKSSGDPAWDEAVLRGLDKTGVLPRDTDGKVYSPALIGFTHRGS